MQTQCGENDTNCFPDEEAIVPFSQIAKNNRFKKFSSKSKQDKFKHRNKRNCFDKQDFSKPCCQNCANGNPGEINYVDWNPTS